MRSLDHPLYTPQEVALAGRYLGHLTTAVRIAQYLRKVKTTAIVGHKLMEGSDRPMILLDDQRTTHTGLSRFSCAPPNVLCKRPSSGIVEQIKMLNAAVGKFLPGYEKNCRRRVLDTHTVATCERSRS